MKGIKQIAIGIAFLLVFLTACKEQKSTQTEKNIEQKVEQLLQQMTLEEKLGQMNQISPFGDDEAIKEGVKNGTIGSILNIIEPNQVNELQRIALEESRLGIPILIARDVIHGFKTIFPIPLGQAATFNPITVEYGARIAAIEASSVGIQWTFAPMIDISRDPRWGRIAESLGEDPYLASTLGSAMVKGFQGDSLHLPTAIAACPKHFVGYGASEGGKDYNSTFIPERQLRNVYLPPFEAAAQAGAATFMTSFNDNDGIPATANSFVLKDILRDEWNFDGIVVTDWASAAEMITHGFVADDKEATEKSVNAGVDMEMVSGMFIRRIPELIKEGKVKEQTINQAVRNILRIKFRLGLFDNPYVDEQAPSPFYNAHHLEAAKQMAVESMILLKNEKETLPLSTDIKTLAVVGPMADAPHDQLGTWIFDGDKQYTQTPLAALKKEFGDQFNILYEPGLEFSRDRNTKHFPQAVNIAQKADAVVLFLGEEAILTGEAHSLADINLVGAQSELVKVLAQTGKPLITVIMAGRPLAIEQEVKLSDAVLYSFHPGTMGGPALVDLLFGKEVPSGKTPVTFPKTSGQIPIYYAHNNTGRPATGNELLLDQIPLEAGQTSLGNTSFHLDAGFHPLFPFGYGLSYTTFEYSNIQLSANQLKEHEVLTISFDLENTGKLRGTEIAQLYVRDVVGSITRPIKELKRYKRVTLDPKEKQKVTFELPIKELAFWNIDLKRVVEPGEFHLWVAPHSAATGEPLVFEVI